jgi:hypothetical protein
MNSRYSRESENPFYQRLSNCPIAILITLFVRNSIENLSVDPARSPFYDPRISSVSPLFADGTGVFRLNFNKVYGQVNP